MSCHLGAGASLCATRGGRSVDTTMGLTPLEGLVMATRSGTVDPGLVLWLVQHGGLAADEVARALESESGLAGLSGIPGGDIRDVLAARAEGDAPATLAFDVYVHRLRRELGAMIAVLGGLDVLVFTGGVGEHAAEVRAAACEPLGFAGVRVDAGRERRPRRRGRDQRGGRGGSHVRRDRARRRRDRPPGARRAGRAVMAVGEGSRVVHVVRAVIREQGEEQVGLAASGAAFWLVIAAFPAAIAAVNIYGLVVSPDDVAKQVGDLASAGPSSLGSTLTDQLEKVAAAGHVGLTAGLVVSLVLAIWSASGGVYNLERAIRTAYGMRPERYMEARRRAFWVHS